MSKCRYDLSFHDSRLVVVDFLLLWHTFIIYPFVTVLDKADVSPRLPELKKRFPPFS